VKRFVIASFFCALLATRALAAEVIPPKPAKYFNDDAHVVSADTAHRLNERLAQFERDTSNQVIVVVFQKMQSDSSIEDYTVRVAHAWGFGQKDLKNGAVLFVFVQDRKMFIQVGYGLEGALPDAICKRIVADEIAPRFRAGNYAAGLEAGVNAMIAAARGEYKGSGKTLRERKGESAGSVFTWVWIAVIVLIVVLNVMGRRRGIYTSRGWTIGGGGWGGWTGGSGGGFGGGGSGGGDSGVSAGGGDFGGGGAGGSW
jgi:uncharacterized protein